MSQVWKKHRSGILGHAHKITGCDFHRASQVAIYWEKHNMRQGLMFTDVVFENNSVRFMCTICLSTGNALSECRNIFHPSDAQSYVPSRTVHNEKKTVRRVFYCSALRKEQWEGLVKSLAHIAINRFIPSLRHVIYTPWPFRPWTCPAQKRIFNFFPAPLLQHPQWMAKHCGKRGKNSHWEYNIKMMWNTSAGILGAWQKERLKQAKLHFGERAPWLRKPNHSNNETRKSGARTIF